MTAITYRNNNTVPLNFEEVDNNFEVITQKISALEADVAVHEVRLDEYVDQVITNVEVYNWLTEDETDISPRIGMVDRFGFVVSDWLSTGITWGSETRFTTTEISTPFISIVEDETHEEVRLTDAAGFYSVLGASPVEAPAATVEAPKWSDGARLNGVSAKLARLLASEAITVRIGITGDSWTDKNIIPQALADRLYAAYGQGGDGWITMSRGSGFCINDIVRSAFTNFTIADLDDDTPDDPPYGPDGYRVDCVTSTGAISFTDIRAESLVLYYRDTTGVFRHRVNGGAWSTVTGGGTNDPAKVTMASGLSTATVHTFDIDTTGNGTTVSLYGVHATGIEGVELSKCGNGGAIASEMATAASSATADFILADMAVDAVVIVCGTNDETQNVAAADFRTAMVSIASSWTQHATVSGVLFACPPQNGTLSAPSMADYGEVMQEAYSDGIGEYINFARLWSDYATEDASAMWLDTLHLDAGGAQRFSANIFNRFFNL